MDASDIRRLRAKMALSINVTLVPPVSSTKKGVPYVELSLIDPYPTFLF